MPSYCLPEVSVAAAGYMLLLGSAGTAAGCHKHGSIAQGRQGREVGARKE